MIKEVYWKHSENALHPLHTVFIEKQYLRYYLSLSYIYQKIKNCSRLHNAFGGSTRNTYAYKRILSSSSWFCLRNKEKMHVVRFDSVDTCYRATNIGIVVSAAKGKSS